jgi:hypothetical protein
MAAGPDLLPAFAARPRGRVSACLAGQVHPLLRLVFLLAVVSVGAANLLPLLLGPRPFDRTALHASAALLRLRPPRDDSWGPMSRALRCVRQEGGARLYPRVFFEERIKYQYPPSALLVLWPGEQESSGVLKVVGAVFLYGSVLFVAAIFLRGLQSQHGSEGAAAWPDRLLAVVVWFALTVTFYPVVWAYTLGQIQVWLNAWFAVLLWAYLTGRKTLAGALLGASCLIKPQYGLLLLWGLLRKQWRFAGAALAVGLAGLLASVALFGLRCHLDYLRVLSFLGRHGESFYPNQSFTGLLHRLLGNGPNLDWQAHAFAPFHPLVYTGTLVAAVLLTALALFGPVRAEHRGSALDLAVATLAGTVTSPIAWEHHYGILLPIYALLIPSLYRQAAGRLVLVLLGLSYVLTSNFFPLVNRLAATPFNFLQSYLLAGALVVLALLFAARARPAALSLGGETATR